MRWETIRHETSTIVLLSYRLVVSAHVSRQTARRQLPPVAEIFRAGHRELVRIIDGEGADAEVEVGENVFALEFPWERLQEDAAMLRGGQGIRYKRLREFIAPAA